VLVLGPRLHDKGVVDRHAVDLDPTLAEIREALDEAGQVPRRARRRESAWHREKHDPATVEQGGRIHRLDAVAHALEGDFGDRVADADVHGRLLMKASA
jgi:hypothetical protein